MIDQQNGNDQEVNNETTTGIQHEDTGQMAIDAVLPENTTVAEPILEDGSPCPLQPPEKRLFGENANQ